MKTIFNKDTIRYYADLFIIIAFAFGVFSWSLDYELSKNTLTKQEQEKNMPPTIFLIQNISRSSLPVA